MAYSTTEIQDINPESAYKPLPDWKKTKKPFDRIEELGELEDHQKDELIMWWKTNKFTSSIVNELNSLTTSPVIPRNEAAEVEEVAAEAGQKFTTANTSMQQLINTSIAETGGNLAYQILMVYKKAYKLSPAPKQAETAYKDISDFNRDKERFELTAKVARAIADTRAQNPDDDMYRVKTAQLVFGEMFRQLNQARTLTVHDIEMDISPIIDSPSEEKADLTSTFMSEPWTPEEREKNKRNYDKLDRLLDKLNASTESKIQLNTLWNWATGEIPQDSSVFKILRYADALDRRVTEELAPIWNAERDRLE
jgi:hypothetical protein